MVKHTTKEAYFERLKNLAEVNKTSLKESQVRNLGSLIDYKRAADGVAYGIVKENHNYYLKKAGTKQDPDVSDFAYIGGLGNITNFKYKSLAEADKQRNMVFHTINEATSLRPDKNGSKKKLNEDVASDEIDKAAEKVGDLDAATDVEAEPALDTDGNAEMAAGLDAKDPVSTPAEEPGPEGGAELPPPEGDTGGEELPPPEGGDELPPEGNEEMPPEDDGTGAEETGAENPEGTGAPEGEEPNSDIEKAVGKISNKIRKTEMEDAQVKSLVGSFLSSFKDKFRDIDIEDRKEMANKILKVVGQDEIDDLGDNVEQGDNEAGPEGLPEDEQPCAECGGFGEYANSRGYGSPESFMECGDEEKANVISGYANAHGEGQNDGDFKTVAIVITPEILEKLKGDYGHEDYANELTPYSSEMNEASEEDKMAQLNELWGGLGNAFKKVGGDIGSGIKKGAQAVGGGLKSAGQAVGGAVQKGAQAVGNVAKAGAEKVGQYAQGVKQSYNQGEINPEVSKLEASAADLGKRIAALNKRVVGAGQQPLNVKSILATIQNQIGAGGQANLGKYRSVAENTDPAYTTVQPSAMIQEDDETDEPETDSTETDSPEHEEGETPEEEKAEHELGGDEFETPEVSGAMGGSLPLIGGSQNLGLSSIKPDGAGVEIVVEPDKTITLNMNEAKRQLIKTIAEGVNKYMAEAKPSAGLSSKVKGAVVKKAKKGENVGKGGFDKVANKAAKEYGSKEAGKKVAAAAMWKNVKKESTEPQEVMTESEQKLRKYVRIRLEEKAGLRKSKLNENTKSPVLKKLDSIIDEQFKLYEKVILKKKDNINEVLGLDKLGINIGPEEKVAASFKKLNPRNVDEINRLFQIAFKNILINPHMSGIGIAAKKATPDEKYFMIKQYVDGGGGTLRLNKMGKLIYAPKEFQDKGTISSFEPGSAQEKTNFMLK